MPITYEKPYSYQPFQWTPEMTKELQTVVEQLKEIVNFFTQVSIKDSTSTQMEAHGVSDGF